MVRKLQLSQTREKQETKGNEQEAENGEEIGG
jgi:hypothetical protein